MRFNDKSKKVQQFQDILINNGYALPKYGADGYLGQEMWQALHNYFIVNSRGNC